MIAVCTSLVPFLALGLLTGLLHEWFGESRATYVGVLAGATGVAAGFAAFALWFVQGVVRLLGAAHQDRDRLAAVIAASPLPVVQFDRARNVVAWNRAAERVFGWSAEEVVGGPPPFVAPAQVEESVRIFERVCAGETLPGTVVRRWHRNGAPLDLEIHAAPVHDPSGAVVGLVGVLADITERRSLEEQLRHAQKMEAVGRLAGGVAHDFNNLLTVILGNTDTAAQKASPAHPVQGPLHEIRRAAERASALTAQLLAVSRKQVLRPRVLEVDQLLRDTESMLRRVIGEDIRLETRLESGGARVEADPGQVEQVLLNLVVNARDAMPQGGRLVLETRVVVLDDEAARTHAGARPGPHVAISVADEGTGMAPEVLARIFEPFFTTKDQGRGSGLGLSMVYGIVRQSGGHVAVWSQPGTGSTFRVFLPRVVAPLPQEPGAAPPASSRGGSETILVAEDNDAVRTLVRDVLRLEGYTVRTASTGREALAIARAHPHLDLLVTDVIMPEMGGRELAERLRGSVPGLRVLYVSGYTADELAQVEATSEAFLQKPFSPRAMAAAVRRILDGAGPGAGPGAAPPVGVGATPPRDV